MSSIAHLQYNLPSNSNSVNYTAPNPQTAPINDEIFDDDGIVTLASNQFTLAAGKYLIRMTCGTGLTAKAVFFLRNITDSTNDGQSINLNQSISLSNQGTALLFAYIDIASTKTYEIQEQAVSSSTGGFGVRSQFTGITEVYCNLTIEKLEEVA